MNKYIELLKDYLDSAIESHEELQTQESQTVVEVLEELLESFEALDS